MKQADPFRGPFLRAGTIGRSHARPNDLGRKIEDRGPTGYAPRLLRKGLDALPEQGHICEQAAALREQYETRKKQTQDAKTGGKSTNQATRPGQAGMRRRGIIYLCCLPFRGRSSHFRQATPLTSPSSPRNAWILTGRILSSHPAH